MSESFAGTVYKWQRADGTYANWTGWLPITTYDFVGASILSYTLRLFTPGGVQPGYYQWGTSEWGFAKLGEVEDTTGMLGDLWGGLTGTPYLFAAKVSFDTATGVWTDGITPRTIAGWTTSTGTPDWQGGFLQRQGSDAVLNSSVAKCLMACDFSMSTAVLGATFGSVDEYVAEDGLTYRACLVPVVFC
jgi:hypothetical protein